MSKVHVNGIDLNYKTVGEGRETIVFSHGCLMNNSMFDGQIDVLKSQFKCISFDHRGHGQSDAPMSGYDMDNLVDDAIASIEAIDCGPVHFIGMSTGGFVGMRIALRRPELIKSLVLMDTSAEGEDEKALKKNNLLLWMVRHFGWWPVIGQALPIMFHKTFLKDPSRQEEVKKWKRIVTGHNKMALWHFGKGIFARDNVLSKLSSISCPTAVVVGEEDIATRPDCSERMAQEIPGALLFKVADAGHSAAIEKPQEVANAILSFYKDSQIIQS
ncbi:MAG: alpha/beta hydrolase [Kangiellaceae bacterium]|jgi:pimeloyl-ACP methyl ester carboxylesterase|nr:alpha/beta hydrolase [Kangiellaceae bacterium]